MANSRRPASSVPAGPYAAVDPALISDIGERLKALSDAILDDEHGLAQRMIELQLKHAEDQQDTLNKLDSVLSILRVQADQIIALTSAVQKLAGETEQHGAELVLLKGKKRQNGSTAV